MKTKKKIVLATGGTGGHLFPAYALAEKLNHDVIFALGQSSVLNNYAMPNYPVYLIPSASVRKKNPLALLRALKVIHKSVKESRAILQKEKPSLVVGFGSFHSFPILCAALLEKLPIVLYESNTKPGLVNRLFSRFAKISTGQFASAQKKLRMPFIEVAHPLPISKLKEKEELLTQKFQLNPNLQTVVIFGGSQGALAINQMWSEVIQICKNRNFQVIHMTGDEKQAKEFKELYQKLGIPAYVKSYEQEMASVMSVADFAICRSGASTIAELIAFELPALLIPYPYATGQHQLKNADFFVEEIKGGVYLEQSKITAKKLNDQIDRFLDAKEHAIYKKNIRNHKKMRQAIELSDVIQQII